VLDDVGMGEGEYGAILGAAVEPDAADVVVELGDDILPAGADPLRLGLDVLGNLDGCRLQIAASLSASSWLRIRLPGASRTDPCSTAGVVVVCS
jgi:hypothetical protein